MIAVDEEGKMGRVKKLIGLRDALEEVDEPHLKARVEMKTRLVKQQDRALVRLPALDQENQIEGQEPLETLASLLEGYRKGAVTVGNLEDEIVAIDIEIQPVL